MTRTASAGDKTRSLGIPFACALVAAAALTAIGCGDDATSRDDGALRLPEVPPPATATGSPAKETPPPGPRVECAIGVELESEPNDTPETATPMTGTGICGVIESSRDVDYITFETPPGTRLRHFQAVIEGAVDFELTHGGETFGPSETAKFGTGVHVVKAFTRDDAPGKYRIRVQFD